MNPGFIVSMDWQGTAEGETILQHFYNPQTSGRKLFGILERPAVPPNVEDVSYKLCLIGGAGVGKTSTVARLAGTKCPTSYCETVGINKTNVYWPVKIWEKIIMFKMQFWDAGDNSSRKYSHVISACENKVDAVMVTFSYQDKSTFTELQQTIPRLSRLPSKPAIICIGTRYASSNKQVTDSEAKEVELKFRVPVLTIENKWTNEKNEVHEVSHLLNLICERLWARDQEYLLRQGLTSSYFAATFEEIPKRYSIFYRSGLKNKIHKLHDLTMGSRDDEF